MKSSFILIAAFALMLVFASSASAVTIVGSGISESHVSLVPTHYEPYPAESGRYVKVWIKAENLNSAPDDNVKLKLVANYPFSFDSTETGERSIGTIELGKQVVVEYNVRVDALALTDDYNNSLFIRQCYDSACATDYIEYPIQISVRRLNPIIDIVSISSSPETITAGKQFALTVNVKNGGSRVKDITVGLDLSSAPFGPLDSATEKQLEFIEADASASIEFKMIATGSAAAGVYKVPITMTYYDEVGNAFNKTDTITLIVGGIPYVYIGAEDVGNLRKDSVTDFVINIVNKGLVDLKLMSLKLVPNDGYRILSPNEIYIGSLKSDDYETAKFKIYLNNASDQTTLGFELIYMDSLNNEYTETKQLTYAVLTNDEAVRFGLEQAQSPLPYVVVLVLLAAYAIYRMRKKKR